MKLKDLIVPIKETTEEPKEEMKEYSLDLREAEDESGLSRVINLRVSDEQLKKLKNKATDSKTSISDFIRTNLFK
jgi:hypothetical protein